MKRPPPRSTRPDTRFPYTTLFRSQPRPTGAPNPLGTTQKGRRFAGLGGWGGGRGVLRLWLRRWAGHDPTVDFATMMQLEPHGPDVFVAHGPRYPWGGLYGGQIVEIGRASCRERVCQYV